VEQGSLVLPKSVGSGHRLHFILGDELPNSDRIRPFSVQGAARIDSRRSGQDAFFFCEQKLIGGSSCFIGFLATGGFCGGTSQAGPCIEKRIQELIPSLEGYIATGMKAFDVPGLAIGIVAGDKLVYAKGFGGRRKGGGELVDARTVFQIGSTTKAFLAASMAITIDHGKVQPPPLVL